MADIVNLGDKLEAHREETARRELTAKMIPILVETVEKLLVMGAKPDQIVMVLRPRSRRSKAASRAEGKK